MTGINQFWSKDFVADQLFNERRLRLLTIVDNFNLECLAITVEHALKEEDVVATMIHLLRKNGLIPQQIQDNALVYLQNPVSLKVSKNFLHHSSRKKTHVDLSHHRNSCKVSCS